MNDFQIACLCLFFASTPIVASIIVRESVKKHRQSIIEDLAKFFKVQVGGANNDNLLHSFEFVKFKYLMRVDRGHGEEEPPDDFRADQWAVMALPLFVLLLLVTVLAAEIAIVSFDLGGDNSIPQSLTEFLKGHRAFRFSLLASIVGAYTYLIRAFYQAVNNFDLTPLSFIGAFNNIIFGVALPQIVFFAVSVMMVSSSFGIGALVVTAFVGGYMPDAVLRYIMATSLIRYFKDEKFDYGENVKSTPIEVLDGIDSLVRSRLSDFHITTVQNLACANPIMLFVETPYGIYQMLDWVGQAQLCASVGPAALFELWKLGIRTIFDLERLALHDDFRNEKVLQAVQGIILKLEPAKGAASPQPEPSPVPQPDRLPQPVEWTSAAIVSNIRMRLDGSYTHRLRQIVNCVSDQLGGPVNRRLL